MYVCACVCVCIGILNTHMRNNNGRNVSYFTWLSYLKWGRHIRSVIYCFTTGTRSKLTGIEDGIFGGENLVKNSPYYSAMSKKVPCSYRLGHKLCCQWTVCTIPSNIFLLQGDKDKWFGKSGKSWRNPGCCHTENKKR